ncbi:MAG: hypothetical protein IPK26_04505 [Planctomycetes bacterium]|nr:hypothetical protein [Planctomycetota bacterium]
MTEAESSRSKKHGKPDKGGGKPNPRPAPQLHQSLVSIDLRNLAAASPTPPMIEELLARITKELRRCGERPSSTPAARMAAAPSPISGGRIPPIGTGGGGGGGTDDERLLEGCTLTSVRYEYVVQNGVARWVRVEQYTCPNGQTYEQRI